MRIVLVAPFGLGEKTTVWARTIPLARHLVSRGCSVTVLIPPWDTPRHAGMAWTEGGVRVINVGVRGGLPRITAQLLVQIRMLRPQIVHVVKPRAYAGIVQWVLWQGRRVHKGGPRLLLDVDDWEQAWSAIGGYSPLVARFLDWQENWGITHADGITAASRWLERKVHEMAPEMPVLYLPNGIAPLDGKEDGLVCPMSRLDDPSCGPSVLLFSRFVEVEPAWMGAFWLALRDLCPAVRLLVGGRALQPGREQAFRAALDVANTAVAWLGYVDREQLPELYARVDCAIFPAADAPLNQAKCSVRLATTLLRGVPVVASAVGEQAHYGAHGAAVLVPADASPQQFARAVADLLAAQQRLVAQARDRLLAEYDWVQLGDRLYEFYAHLLAEKPG